MADVKVQVANCGVMVNSSTLYRMVINGENRQKMVAIGSESN